MLAAVPMTIALFASYYLPESPRWLVSQGRTEDARQLLISAAEVNGQILEPFVLDAGCHTESEGSIKDLLLPKYRNLNFAVWTVWLSYGFVYYGIILFVTRIFIEDDGDDDDGQCHFDYFSIFLSGMTEFAAVAFALVLIPRASRNRLQVYNYLLCGVSCVCLGFVAGLEAQVVFAALVRLFVRTGLAVTWVASPELYPTHVRATAHASASSMTRVGGFLCPFVVINDSISQRDVCIVLMVVSVIAALASLCTPDTTNVDLDAVVPENAIVNPLQRLSVGSLDRRSLEKVNTRSGSDDEKTQLDKKVRHSMNISA